MAKDTVTATAVVSQPQENEVWRRSSIEPRVLVSSLGRVLLQPSAAPLPNGGYRLYETSPTFGNVARASATAGHTYRNIVVRGNTHKVHSLICEAFYGPRPQGAVVIHIDEDAHNNRADNLKWGSQRENMNMPKIKAYHRARTGAANPQNIGKARRDATQ